MKPTVLLIIFLSGVAAILSYGDEPGKVAVDYLRKIRAGDVNLKPGEDTALKKSTSESKRQTIREYLGRLKVELGKAEFEASHVRIDGEHAAALVRRVDDSMLEVYAVAMVKDGEEWKPAPMLASFENAVDGYTVGVGEKLWEIEEWMSRERVIDLERLISEKEDKLRAKIRDSIVGEVLEGGDLGAILKGFTDALMKEQPMVMLGYLGGAGEVWPEDWRLVTRAVDAAVESRANDRFPWRLLTSPKVLRQVLHEEKSQKEGALTMVCHDPEKIGKIGAHEGMFTLRFDFKKNADNLWQMVLPEAFLSGNRALLRKEADGEDEALYEEFVARVGKQLGHEPIKSLEDCEMRLLKAYQEGDVESFMRMANVGGWKDDVVEKFESLGLMWRSVYKPGIICKPIRLDGLEEEKFLVVAYQFFSLGKADLYDRLIFCFRRNEGGFELLAQGAKMLGKKERRTVKEWIEKNSKRWEGGWQKSLLEGMAWVNQLPMRGAVEDAEVEKFAEEWLSALKRRDVGAILGLCAYLGENDVMPKRALSSLFYELSNAQRRESRFFKIYQKDGWVALGIEHKEAKKLWRSFMPLVVTEEGLMALPDVDLIEEKGRNRDFLNRTSFDRLSQFTRKEDLERLKGMFEDFQKDFREVGGMKD